jgi:hypothetical protein
VRSTLPSLKFITLRKKKNNIQKTLAQKKKKKEKETLGEVGQDGHGKVVGDVTEDSVRLVVPDGDLVACGVQNVVVSPLGGVPAQG